MLHLTHSIAIINPVELAIGITALVILLMVLAFFLAFNEGRRTLRKFWYLTINLFGIDIGIGGFIRILLLSLIPAIGVAFGKGFGANGFDWHLFVYVGLVIIAVNILNNFISSNTKVRDFFSPKSGRKWLNERKAALSGIIKRININIAKGTTVSDEEIKHIVRDILDTIVLHVRDYRGSHDDNKKEVFANLLVAHGDNLIVAVRDSVSTSSQYERTTPATYPKASMLCGRAMESRKPLSVGMLKDEYPEAPRNKPYESILAIPLFSTNGDRVYGCLSIDCSRPYFFQSFTPGSAENEMENSLQPYLQLITMTIECFGGRSPEALTGRLLGLS